VAFGDNPFWERNAYAEALLAIGMAVLEKVVPNLFVGQSLECFRELYPVVVDHFFGDISGQVFLPFVRMLSKAEPPVEALDFFLAGGLDLCQSMLKISPGAVVPDSPSKPPKHHMDPRSWG
jgi:hypothetical protein